MNLELTFLGASETVTGSKFHISTPEKNILVDCGLFQGLKKLRLLNWKNLPVDVSAIDTVLLTHGHLDHTGYLPRLGKLGFRGEILGTEPTLDIAEIILLDSAKIQEDEAERANREGYSRHKPAEPLYTIRDVEKIFPMFRNVKEDEWQTLSENIRVRFRHAGHILGATFIELDVFGKRLVFSGDIGRTGDLLLAPPVKPDRADVLFLESTYGDRAHVTENYEERITTVVNETIAAGGNLIIPSFVVERAQVLMYLLWQLRKKKAIPDVPMVLDSPMGADMLKIFFHNHTFHNLSKEDCIRLIEMFRIVKSYDETQEVLDDREPKIVIAGSGMLTGGRVLTYLEKYISKPETTVLMVGYQAEGTRGRALLEGAQELKFFGGYHKVHARIELISGLSAHADQQGLLDWSSDITNKPEHVFLIHGEPKVMDVLRVKLKTERGWDAEIPGLYSSVVL